MREALSVEASYPAAADFTAVEFISPGILLLQPLMEACNCPTNVFNRKGPSVFFLYTYKASCPAYVFVLQGPAYVFVLQGPAADFFHQAYKRAGVQRSGDRHRAALDSPCNT
ncbi:uncharacterized protein [Miscanthus floridulus]|uniref:uncharacterized protein n=1 Tax=Miscanthus floridulus TaxID=154761 RepID=UPI00345A95CE